MSFKEGYRIIEHIAALSVFLPILLCIYRIRALNRTLWALFFYLICCVAADRISLAVLPNEETANIVFNCFTIIEVSIIFYMYFYQYNSAKAKVGITVFLALLISLSLYVFVVQGGYDQTDTVIRTIESVGIIILSGGFFYNLLLDKTISKPPQHYFYWINLSFLIYFSSVLLLFMNTDFLDRCTPTTAYILWGLHQLLNILTNILISIGLWNQKRI